MEKKILFSLLIVLIPVLIFAYYFPPEGGVGRISTELTYQGALSGQYSDSVDFQAELVAQPTQEGLTGKDIFFTLEAQETSAITNEQGIAITDLVLNQGAGEYTLLTIFEGDDYFSGSSDSDSFEILKEDTSLAYTGPSSGESGSIVVLTAELSELDQKTGDLSGKRIIFQLGDSSVTDTTDADGLAEVEMNLDGVPADVYTLTVEFEGDALYLSSSDSTEFEVTGGAGGDGGGDECFIATAAYGSSLAPEIETLQRFRDQYLLENDLGQQFVSGYYQYGPVLAGYIREREDLKKIIRTGLDLLIKMTNLLVY